MATISGPMFHFQMGFLECVDHHGGDMECHDYSNCRFLINIGTFRKGERYDRVSVYYRVDRIIIEAWEFDRRDSWEKPSRIPDRRSEFVYTI